MFRSHLRIPADAAELLSPAARVEHRPTPSLLWLACWGVALGAAALLGLAALPRDVVAVADGELVPTVPPERLHAGHKGTLRDVCVKMGQRVGAGEKLGELDLGAAAKDVPGLTRQRDGLEAQVACLGAAATDPAAPVLAAHADDSPARRTQLEDAAYRRSEFVAAHQYRTALVTEARAARDAAAQRAGRLKGKVEGLAEKEKLLLRAAAGGSGGRLECIQAQLDRAEAEGQLADAEEAEKDWHAKAAARGAELIAFVEGRRLAAAEQRTTAERELARVRQELARAEQTAGQGALFSRSAGVVVEVPTAAVGSSVQEGAPLFAVVSLDSPLAVEADLRAEDAPRVHAGCEVRVKLDKGFPPSIHGYFVGRVEHVAPHATLVAPQPAGGPAREPMYRMRVAVERSEFRLRTGDAPIPFPATVGHALDLGLRPGAPVTTDALVGTRRVYEFLLDPLLRTGAESFREP